MHHAFVEELGELEEGMRRAFYGSFGRDIKIKLEKGVLLPSSFDGMNSDEMTLKQIIEGPPEYRGRKNRNKEILIS